MHYPRIHSVSQGPQYGRDAMRGTLSGIAIVCRSTLSRGTATASASRQVCADLRQCALLKLLSQTARFSLRSPSSPGSDDASIKIWRLDPRHVSARRHGMRLTGLNIVAHAYHSILNPRMLPAGQTGEGRERAGRPHGRDCVHKMGPYHRRPVSVDRQ